jgi:Ca2+-binding RTX toxin-like protein
MKKLLSFALAAIATAAFLAAPASGSPGVVVILAGGEEADTISIDYSTEVAHSFVIDSASPLEVGGGVCTHPEGMMNELLCDSTRVSGFEVNAGGGDDTVTVGRTVGVAVTLRGGPGNDQLVGGSSVFGDKLVGGAGDDVLMGRAGPDLLYGGPGNDRLYGGPDEDKLVGGPGNDVLRGEGGEDVLLGGPGENELFQ